MGAINRRQAFLLGGGFVALTVLPMAANAEPSNDAAEMIKKFTGGKEAANAEPSFTHFSSRRFVRRSADARRADSATRTTSTH